MFEMHLESWIPDLLDDLSNDLELVAGKRFTRIDHERASSRVLTPSKRGDQDWDQKGIGLPTADAGDDDLGRPFSMPELRKNNPPSRFELESAKSDILRVTFPFRKHRSNGQGDLCHRFVKIGSPFGRR